MLITQQSSQRQTHSPSAEAFAVNDVPSGKARRLFAIAMQKEGLLPAHLFNGMRKAGLTGRGLLICAIDARSSQEDEIKLQVPLFKEPLLKPLCKLLQEHPAARQSNRDFWDSLPRHATFSFFFLPTELWKSKVQKSLSIQAPRKALKSKDLVLVLACLFATPKATEQLAGGRGHVLVQQHHIMRPGATIPKAVVARLDDQQKANVWDIMCPDRPEGLAAFIMACMGLDPVILKEEPLFQQLQQDFDRRFHDWMRDCRRARLIAAWYPDADEVADAIEDLWRYIAGFFMVEKPAEMMQLWGIMGRDRVKETLDRISAQEQARLGQVERYVQHFGQQVARPCPACGMPLACAGYSCGCQRPPLQAPQAPTKSLPPADASAADKLPKHRRKKNIQTSFGHATLGGRPKHKQPKANDGSSPAPQPKAAPADAARRPDKQAKHAKDEELAMARLRAQVALHLPHGLREDGPGQPSSSSRPGSSRKSRRALPQGDRKLALKLAAGELLSEKHEPK